LIKATVSGATFGLVEAAFDFCFQNKQTPHDANGGLPQAGREAELASMLERLVPGEPASPGPSWCMVVV